MAIHYNKVKRSLERFISIHDDEHFIHIYPSEDGDVWFVNVITRNLKIVFTSIPYRSRAHVKRLCDKVFPSHKKIFTKTPNTGNNII